MQRIRSEMSSIELESPIGRLRVSATTDGITNIQFLGGSHGEACQHRGDHGAQDLLDEAATQLSAYFEGTRRAFDLPLQPYGTEFQLEVWRALLKIPWGATTTYGEIAHQIHRPKAVRAVGAANGRNPIPIIIPCHRVIGSDGSLTGYAGGLDIKAALLDLEGVLDPRTMQPSLFDHIAQSSQHLYDR